MEPQGPTVEAVARTVVGDPSASLLEWSSERLGAGASKELGQSEGLLRISGLVATKGGQERWSAIVKALRDSQILIGDDRAQKQPYLLDLGEEALLTAV